MNALTAYYSEYEAEQKSLAVAIAEAEDSLMDYQEDTARVEQFLALAKKYTDFSELTTPMINEFIDKIIVHTPEKVDGDRVQEVEIYLNFIGKYELPAAELTEEEIKREAFLKKERARSRERYQKLKSGERAVGVPITQTCKCCGKTFEARSTAKLFCNVNCRAKYYRQEAVKPSAKTAERPLPLREAIQNTAVMSAGQKPTAKCRKNAMRLNDNR
ncbi:DUF4368 domain-containing protein [[Clostridium] innocuum]|nr:DUF4368 domain-containing protein [[Clostridium] innocuum]